jgi:hypothetical protein
MLQFVFEYRGSHVPPRNSGYVSVPAESLLTVGEIRSSQQIRGCRIAFTSEDCPDNLLKNVKNEVQLATLGSGTFFVYPVVANALSRRVKRATEELDRKIHAAEQNQPAQGHSVNLAEDLKAMNKLMKSHSEDKDDREFLSSTYGGDCERFARMRNLADDATRCCRNLDVVNRFSKLLDIIQGVLEDVGGCVHIQKAIEYQRQLQLNRRRESERDQVTRDWYAMEYEVEDWVPLTCSACSIDEEEHPDKDEVCDCCRSSHQEQDRTSLAFLAQISSLKKRLREKDEESSLDKKRLKLCADSFGRCPVPGCERPAGHNGHCEGEV